MSSILFGLTLGIDNPDELDEVLAICKRIAAEHPDAKPDLDRLLQIVVKERKTEV